MPEYRIFTTGLDGHFYSSTPLGCADDTEAMKQAKQLVGGHDIELWHRKAIQYVQSAKMKR